MSAETISLTEGTIIEEQKLSDKTVIRKKKKISSDQLSVNIVGALAVGIFALICVIPFYLIIVASFTSETSLIRDGYPILPRLSELSLQSYALCLKNPTAILKAYGMTISVTVIGTFLSVMLATMTGYVLSRKDFQYCGAYPSADVLRVEHDHCKIIYDRNSCRDFGIRKDRWCK